MIAQLKYENSIPLAASTQWGSEEEAEVFKLGNRVRGRAWRLRWETLNEAQQDEVSCAQLAERTGERFCRQELSITVLKKNNLV